jgi:2-dehydro-3-deoxyphosphogluconate aldolase / (4S)-4-hydroxy-2-oxoglutarate aldolase
MAILRYPAGGDVPRAIAAIAAGGVTVLEVTVDTPGAWQAIEEAAARTGLVVGGGTVTEVAQVERLASVGARFIVSPGFDAELVASAARLGLDALPGVATGTEIMAARRAGSRLFKLFPAASLGIRCLTELRGPFANEWFIPTGGISIDGIAEWLSAGAVAVAVGSDLAGRAAPRTAAEVALLTEKAKRAIDAAGSVLAGRVGTA